MIFRFIVIFFLFFTNYSFSETEVLEKKLELTSIYSPYKVRFFGVFPKDYKELKIKIKGPKANFTLREKHTIQNMKNYSFYGGYEKSEILNENPKLISFLRDKGLVIDKINYQTNNKQLFWGVFTLPKNGLAGKYEIDYFFFNQQGEIKKQSNHFFLQRNNMQNIFYELAHSYPLLNAIIIIILAITTTQVINFLSYKLRS